MIRSKLGSVIATDPFVFSERINKRWRVWWSTPTDWWKPRHLTPLMLRARQRHLVKRASDSLESWKRGTHWQRALSNKWNAREFARMHGIRVPVLYWTGRRISKLPFRSLPEHFVIRPTWSQARDGVFVISSGFDLLSQREFTTKQLADELRGNSQRSWVDLLLVEEFVRTEQGEYCLPVEYKCHLFGNVIGAIQVIQRATGKQPKANHRFYTPSWEPFEDPMNTLLPSGQCIEPPNCLDEIVQCAQRLGRAYETYVRVDLYATNRGCVFGEFSTTPASGRGFTKFADEYFESLWQDNCPDQL